MDLLWTLVPEAGFFTPLKAVVQHQRDEPGSEGSAALKSGQVEIRLDECFLDQVLRILVVEVIRPSRFIQVGVVSSDQDLKQCGVTSKDFRNDFFITVRFKF